MILDLIQLKTSGNGHSLWESDFLQMEMFLWLPVAHIPGGKKALACLLWEMSLRLEKEPEGFGE